MGWGGTLSGTMSSSLNHPRVDKQTPPTVKKSFQRLFAEISIRRIYVTSSLHFSRSTLVNLGIFAVIAWNTTVCSEFLSLVSFIPLEFMGQFKDVSDKRDTNISDSFSSNFQQRTNSTLSLLFLIISSFVYLLRFLLIYYIYRTLRDGY